MDVTRCCMNTLDLWAYVGSCLNLFACTTCFGCGSFFSFFLGASFCKVLCDSFGGGISVLLLLLLLLLSTDCGWLCAVHYRLGYLGFFSSSSSSSRCMAWRRVFVHMFLLSVTWPVMLILQLMFTLINCLPGFTCVLLPSSYLVPHLHFSPYHVSTRASFYLGFVCILSRSGLSPLYEKRFRCCDDQYVFHHLLHTCLLGCICIVSAQRMPKLYTLQS